MKDVFQAGSFRMTGIEQIVVIMTIFSIETNYSLIENSTINTNGTQKASV